MIAHAPPGRVRDAGGRVAPALVPLVFMDYSLRPRCARHSEIYATWLAIAASGREAGMPSVAQEVVELEQES